MKTLDYGNLFKEYNKIILGIGCHCSECINIETKKFLKKLIISKFSFIPFLLSYDKLRYESNSNEDTVYNTINIMNDVIKYNNEFNEKEDVYNCCFCGKLHTKFKKYKDLYICKFCFSQYCKECFDCKKIYSFYINENIYNFYNIYGSYIDYCNDRRRKIICESCYIKYKECKICKFRSKNKEEMKSISKKRDQNGVEIFIDICTHCIKTRSIPCNSCGEKTIFQKDGLCNRCYEKENSFFDYNYKPLYLLFLKSSTENNINIDKSLFFGFELEIESNRSIIQSSHTMGHLLRDHIGRDKIYTVHDGSITRNLNHSASGLEVVSYPFTWDEYREKGKHRIDDLLLFIRSKRWESNRGTCGFHIHSTKSMWGTYQIYKLIQFMYNKLNHNFMFQIAGRKPNSYCFIEPADFDQSILVAKDKKNRRADHYSWVNLNNKSGDVGKTIEFRMFVGSLEPLIIHKNLEFVMATYLFTKDNNKNKMLDNYFMEFVENNKRKFPCLFEYFKLIKL